MPSEITLICTCPGNSSGVRMKRGFKRRVWLVIACAACRLVVGLVPGVHPRCWNLFDLGSGGGVDNGTHVSDELPLPDLKEIICTPIRTKEFLPMSLVPLAREEYGKLVADVLRASRPDAWSPLEDPENPLGDGIGGADSQAHRAARRAWLPLLMFPKCVLRQFRRGQRPHQSFHFTKALLIRWRLGEAGGFVH